MGVDEPPGDTARDRETRPRHETPWDHEARPAPEPPPGMPMRSKVIAGAVFGVLYAAYMTAQGHLVPGALGGILAAVVLVMVLGRLEERRRQRHRERYR